LVYVSPLRLSFPRPPSSTLFPYTTLFRSDGPGGRASLAVLAQGVLAELGEIGGDTLGQVFLQQPRGDRNGIGDAFGTGAAVRFRSEEHTSELQSRENLVCRLLLEKKKMRV